MRRSLFLVGVALLVLLDAGAGWAGAAEHGSGGGFFKLRYDLGLWTIIVFLGLLFILKKYAWGPILEGLHKREQGIQGAIQEAHAAREEAQRVRAELQAQLDRAGEQVREILEAGRRDATRLHDDMIAKARADIQAERDRVRREIDLASDQALHELWTQSAQLATLISAKAIGRQIQESDHRRLLDEALAELGPAGKEWQRQGGNGHA